MCLYTKDKVESACPSGYIGCGEDSCIQNQCLALVVQRDETKNKKLLSQEKKEEKTIKTTQENSDDITNIVNHDDDHFFRLGPLASSALLSPHTGGQTNLFPQPSKFFLETIRDQLNCTFVF